MIKKKMEYLKDKGEVTEKETEKVDEIVEKSSTTDQVINKVRNNFDLTPFGKVNNVKSCGDFPSGQPSRGFSRRRNLLSPWLMGCVFGW